MTAQGMYYLIRALVTLIAIPFHEAGHALAAWLLGDPTAKREGRISLNPFRHFDLVGTLCMIFAGVGWAKPVSTDPRNFKNPKWGMALTALAGPAANLLLAYLGMVAWKILYYWAPTTMITVFAARFLQYFVMMDVALRCSTYPHPPLDAAASCWWCCPSASTFRSCGTSASSSSSCWQLSGPVCWMACWAHSMMWSGICWISAPATSTRSPILRIMQPSGR